MASTRNQNKIENLDLAGVFDSVYGMLENSFDKFCSEGAFNRAYEPEYVTFPSPKFVSEIIHQQNTWIDPEMMDILLNEQRYVPLRSAVQCTTAAEIKTILVHSENNPITAIDEIYEVSEDSETEYTYEDEEEYEDDYEDEFEEEFGGIENYLPGYIYEDEDMEQYTSEYIYEDHGIEEYQPNYIYEAGDKVFESYPSEYIYEDEGMEQYASEYIYGDNEIEDYQSEYDYEDEEIEEYSSEYTYDGEDEEFEDYQSQASYPSSGFVSEEEAEILVDETLQCAVCERQVCATQKDLHTHSVFHHYAGQICGNPINQQRSPQYPVLSNGTWYFL